MTNAHQETAVFAAEGPGRHRLLRAALVGGAALLAAWLIALGLGVAGGFEALPALPQFHKDSSSEASQQATVKAEPVSTPAASAQSQSSGTDQSTRSTARAPVSTKPAKVKRPAAGTQTTAPTKPGRRIGATTGGNGQATPHGRGPDGTGPPGQN